MKYFIKTILLGVMIVFFSSCRKEGTTEEITNSTSIVGNWELRQGQSSMIPAIEYSPGNGNIVKFSNSIYERYTDGNLVKIGSYFIIKDTSVVEEVGLVIPAGQFTNRIIFDSVFSSPKTFIEVSDNKLILLSGYFPLDGGSRVLYERQANLPIK